MTYALTLVAALVVALGEVVQQQWATHAPEGLRLSPRLLLWLVRRPGWLAGVVCSLVGNGLFSVALHSGGVIRIEAVFVARLLFVLLIAAIWRRHGLPRKEVLGAGAITAGIVVFLLVAEPTRGNPGGAADLRWAIVGGLLLAGAGLLASIARRTGPIRRATLLGAAAGMLFGMQAALIQSAVIVLAHGGVLALLTTWDGYAVVAVALLGMLLVQSAFAAAPIEASYPAVVTGQLLTALLVGVTVLGGSLRTGPVHLAVLVVALLAMVAGIRLLAGSALVTGGPTRSEQRR